MTKEVKKAKKLPLNKKTKENRDNQLNPNNKEFKGCKPPKEVRKYVHEQQKKYQKSIKEIIPIIQSEKAKAGEAIETGSIESKTQSAIDKCDSLIKEK